MKEATTGDGPGSRPGFVAWVSVIVVALILAFPSLPGRMNADALDMYGQALRGDYRDWHIPLVSWIWRSIGASPSLIAVQSVLVVSAFVAAFTRSFRLTGLGHWWSLAAAAALAIFPPVYGYLVAVFKDTWFAAILVWLFVLSAVPQCPYMMVLRAVLIALAAIIRPETILLLPVFALAEFLLFGRRWRRVLVLCAIVVGLLVANNQFTYRLLQAERTNPESVIFLFDLAGLSVRTNQMLLPPAAFPPRDLEVLKKHYDSRNFSTIAWSKPAEEMVVRVRGDDARMLRDTWMRAIINHPSTYLRGRLAVFGSHMKSRWPFHKGIDKRKVIALFFPNLNWAVNFLLRRVPQWLFSHWISFLGSVALLIVLWRRRHDLWTQVPLAYLAIGLAYEITLMPLIVTDAFRLGYASVVIFYLIAALTLARYRHEFVAGSAVIVDRLKRRLSGAAYRRR